MANHFTSLSQVLTHDGDSVSTTLSSAAPAPDAGGGAKPEKPLKAITAVQSKSSTDTDEPPTSANPSYRWRPSIFRLRPFLGFLALGITLACMLTSLAILIASDGVPQKSWTWQPTVYLAIATAISNTAVQAALAQAVPISWWNKVFNGSTIRDLEFEWESGQSFPRAMLKALRQRRFLNLLTVAGIATGLVIIDGPLLQRASSVQWASTSKNVTLDIGLSPELPTGLSGVIEIGSAASEFYITKTCGELITAYFKKLPITSTVNCDGTCAATVRGPGLAPAGCVSMEWSVNASTLSDPSATWYELSKTHSNPAAEPAGRSAFFSYMSPNISAKGPETLDIAFGGLNMTNCTGEYLYHSCSYVSAILEYDVLVQDNSITFAKPASSGRVVAIANNTQLDPFSSELQPLTFLGLAAEILPLLISNVTLDKSGELLITSFNQFAEDYLFSGTTCDWLTNDPTDYIVSQVNELMFRAGLLSLSLSNTTALLDPGLSVNQTVPAQQSLQGNVYRSDLRWFAGAAALQILTILIILPTFWGWWNLGNELSLSPFETAKMLDAPLLKDVNSAAGATGIEQEMGDTKVKMGAVEVRSRDGDYSVVSGSRVGIAEPYKVVAPLTGARFTY